MLGDGEFDGPRLQHTVQADHWSYVVRTGSNITVAWDGDNFRCETVAACIKPGTFVALRDVLITEAAYGPIMLLCCWAKGIKIPCIGSRPKVGRRGVSPVYKTVSD